MMLKHSLLSFASILTLSSIAHADSDDAVAAHAMPAISGALELAFGGTSTMSVGEVGGGMADAADLIGPGGALELQIGYRLTPALAIGAYGTLQPFSDGSGHESDPDSQGGAIGIEADYHTSPRSDVDPWISVGTGVRWLRVDDDGRSTLIGAELARLQVGADFRVTESVALGPVLGVSASYYEAQNTPMSSGYEELADKGVHWTLSAGVAVRFNAFGSRTR